MQVTYQMFEWLMDRNIIISKFNGYLLGWKAHVAEKWIILPVALFFEH